MQITLKGAVVGALAVAGAILATTQAEAMPVSPLAPVVAADTHVEQAYWYGYRRPFVRRFYGVRPWGWGYRRFGYGYGWRRPFYGYHRAWGWRRW